MQDTIQTKAEDFLKDFENQYKLYRITECTEKSQVIDIVATKNHELTIKMIGGKLCVSVEFNYESDGIYEEKHSAWVDDLTFTGVNGKSFGFFKSQKDAAGAILINQIKRLKDEFKYQSKICDDLKTKIDNFQKKLFGGTYYEI